MMAEELFRFMMNYYALETHFLIYGKELLENILKRVKDNVDYLEESEPSEEKGREQSPMSNIFKLCDLVTREIIEQDLRQNITTMQTILQTQIVENNEKIITSDRMKEILKSLKAIAISIEYMYGTIGRSYATSIAKLERQGMVFAQVGDSGTIHHVCDIQHHPDLISMQQFGKYNSINIYLHGYGAFKQTSNGPVGIKLMLWSDEKQPWERISNNAENINIQQLNATEALHEKNIVVDGVIKSCLEVRFHTSGTVPIQECFRSLFEVLFEALGADDILRKSSVTEIKVYGFVEKLKDGYMHRRSTGPSPSETKTVKKAGQDS